MASRPTTASAIPNADAIPCPRNTNADALSEAKPHKNTDALG